MIEKLTGYLEKLHPLGDDLKKRIIELAMVHEYKKGDHILREGQVCTKACMVGSGLVRSYYLNEGRDITSRFMEEGMIVTSWISYYSQKPGNEFIEATEDTILIALHYDDIQNLYKEFPEFNVIGRRQTELAFYLSEQRTQMLRKHTAEEKYKFFLTHHPALLQRVPLKQIASYLGMNEETLSRVRSKYHKTS